MVWIGEADLLAAIQALDAEAPEERDRAAETVFGFVLATVRQVIFGFGPWEELGAQVAEVEVSTEVADDFVSRLCSNRQVRNRVLAAKHPIQYVQRRILHVIMDRYRNLGRAARLARSNVDIGKLEDLHSLDLLMQRLEAADILQHLRTRISTEEWDLLRMRYWEGMTIREVSQRLGVSYCASARRLCRLQGNLRRILVEGDAPSPGSEALEPVAAGVPSPERRPKWEPGKKPKKTACGRERSGASPSQRAVAAERFRRLAAAWRDARGPTSSLTEMAMRPEYQQIIGMGRDAVPLVLEELQKEPDHWFWALAAMTGEDPVPPEHKGKLADMTKDWLQWGRQHGYLQADDA